MVYILLLTRLTAGQRYVIDGRDRYLADIEVALQTDMGGIASNAFGEHYLFGVNRNLFQDSDASSVFRSYFGDRLFQEDTFYVIAGTDSGLLYQFVKAQGFPKGSRYLFVELPEILAVMEGLDDSRAELAVTTGESWLEQARDMGVENYAVQDRLVLLRSLGVVHGHYSQYPPFWRQLKSDFDIFRFDQRVSLSSRPFIICQIENLSENQTPAICLTGAFSGKTAVVLAGGPSLDDLLPWVRQHRRNLLVIAVSRISRSLIDSGIQPDISVSVDPIAYNLNVCKDMLEFQNGTLLVNNYHLSPNLLASWGGQKVFAGARYPWSTPLEPENIPPVPGTTVTNTALDLAVKSGAGQIILGGADFCFNQEGYTHAKGTVEHAMGGRLQLGDQQVETNSGMMADTENGYLHSAMSIDLQARNAGMQGCRIINPAPGAMRLPHVEHIPLEDIQIEPLSQPAQAILANLVPPVDKSSRVRLYQEELQEVDRVLAEIRNIKELSGKALAYNKKLFATGERDAGFHNKAKMDRIEEQLDGRYADTAYFIKRFGVQRFVPILRFHDLREEGREENSRLYFQAFLDTCRELTDILRSARARIISRLEEEKPRPNIQRLLDQWQRDEQPGRAIQWARLHESHVNQLPQAQQQALGKFKDTFDSSVEALGRSYTRDIEQKGDMDSIAGRAREYFLCGDLKGLKRVLAGLRAHRDQQQVKPIIPLVDGYIAELEYRPEMAISAYQSISEGATHIDALMRLFELHSRAEDWPSALDVLKALSSISSTYSPMYADMLHAGGDVDAAVEIYTNYILANPADLNSVMKLGMIFRQAGSTEGVEWAMGYILDKEPGNYRARELMDELNCSEEAESIHPG
jgi:6-hydroxymethylpterin diphosphokinase MptE-like